MAIDIDASNYDHRGRKRIVARRYRCINILVIALGAALWFSTHAHGQGEVRNEFIGSYSLEIVDSRTHDTIHMEGWSDTTQAFLRIREKGKIQVVYFGDLERDRALRKMRGDAQPEMLTPGKKVSIASVPARTVALPGRRELLGHRCKEYLVVRPGQDTVHYWVADIGASPFPDLWKWTSNKWMGELGHLLKVDRLREGVPLLISNKDRTIRVTACVAGPQPRPRLFEGMRGSEPSPPSRIDPMRSVAATPPDSVPAWITLQSRVPHLPLLYHPIKPPHVPASGEAAFICTVLHTGQIVAYDAIPLDADGYWMTDAHTITPLEELALGLLQDFRFGTLSDGKEAMVVIRFRFNASP